jgi:cytochrome b pre-mRNA-processing protein 3
MILNLWKARNARRTRAEALYRTIVRQTRRPEFYASGGVTDTFEGRFELLTAHMALMLYRLKGGDNEEKVLSQTLFDLFFADMDAALRELGVGDTSVGKRIREMSEAFYGRLEAYDAGLAAEDDAEPLCRAVARNLYNGAPPSPGHAALMADYMRRTLRHLREADPDHLANAEPGGLFIEPPEFERAAAGAAENLA